MMEPVLEKFPTDTTLSLPGEGLANLIHAAPEFPLHMTLNLMALVALGFLLERPLGTARDRDARRLRISSAPSSWSPYCSSLRLSRQTSLDLEP